MSTNALDAMFGTIDPPDSWMVLPESYSNDLKQSYWLDQAQSNQQILVAPLQRIFITFSLSFPSQLKKENKEDIVNSRNEENMDPAKLQRILKLTMQKMQHPGQEVTIFYFLRMT